MAIVTSSENTLYLDIAVSLLFLFKLLIDFIHHMF